MNCVNCKYFKPFYIKLFTAYSKTNRGYCMKSKQKKKEVKMNIYVIVGSQMKKQQAKRKL